MSVPTACFPLWSTGSATREIAVVDGEGIGPEVVGAAVTVLAAAVDRFDLDISVSRSGPVGAVGPSGFGLDDRAVAFFDDTVDVKVPVLTGPAGGRFVYELRARYDLFVKFVPIRNDPELADASIVRPERIRDVDILIIRDNIGGLYQGRFGRYDDGRSAYQEAHYSSDQVDRLLEVACSAARERNGRLAVVTKPGGIPSISALWHERADHRAQGDVTIDVIEVDNACFQLVADPKRFDVVVAPNMLGDVVADTAALLLGSRGLAYSANFRSDGAAVYQTGHGAAHDLAGLDVANPVAQIRSLAWLLRDSLNMPDVASAIDGAVSRTLGDALRTADIAGPSSTVVGTQAFAEAVSARLPSALSCGPSW